MASFVGHIIIVILPYYCHDWEALQREPENEELYWESQGESPVSSLSPLFFSDTLQGLGRLICTGVLMEGEEKDGRREK